MGIMECLAWLGLCIYFVEETGGREDGRKMLAGPSSSHVKTDGKSANMNKNK